MAELGKEGEGEGAAGRERYYYELWMWKEGAEGKWVCLEEQLYRL